MAELILSFVALALAFTAPYALINTDLWLKKNQARSNHCSADLLHYLASYRPIECDPPAIDHSAPDLPSGADPQAICVLLYFSGEFTKMKGPYKCNYLLTDGPH
jgi:hypothetical protein